MDNNSLKKWKPSFWQRLAFLFNPNASTIVKELGFREEQLETSKQQFEHEKNIWASSTDLVSRKEALDQKESIFSRRKSDFERYVNKTLIDIKNANEEISQAKAMFKQEQEAFFSDTDLVEKKQMLDEQLANVENQQSELKYRSELLAKAEADFQKKSDAFEWTQGSLERQKSAESEAKRLTEELQTQLQCAESEAKSLTEKLQTQLQRAQAREQEARAREQEAAQIIREDNEICGNTTDLTDAMVIAKQKTVNRFTADLEGDEAELQSKILELQKYGSVLGSNYKQSALQEIYALIGKRLACVTALADSDYLTKDERSMTLNWVFEYGNTILKAARELAPYRKKGKDVIYSGGTNRFATAYCEYFNLIPVSDRVNDKMRYDVDKRGHLYDMEEMYKKYADLSGEKGNDRKRDPLFKGEVPVDALSVLKKYLKGFEEKAYNIAQSNVEQTDDLER